MVTGSNGAQTLGREFDAEDEKSDIKKWAKREGGHFVGAFEVLKVGNPGKVGNQPRAIADCGCGLGIEIFLAEQSGTKRNC